MIESIEDQDRFWGRTPSRFYDEEEVVVRAQNDLPPSPDNQMLFELDNRLETALEATRPSLGSSMLEPSGQIQTPLMPFQKKALAWMYGKELNVSEDEGALLPQWISFKRKNGETTKWIEKVYGKKLKVESSSEVIAPSTVYMDILTGTLSRRRFASRKSEPGGCLCDSMGLGKSLTSLSLIETHQRNPSYEDTSRSAQLALSMEEDLKPFCSNSTLLVVPASLVHQWYSEVGKHLGIEAEEDQPGYILRYKRGGTIPWTSNDDRQEVRKKAKDILAGDTQATIVLATYEDLRYELQVSKKSKKAISPLLDIHWWRIMLDEAQLVSTSNGSAAEMVNCLWRTNGWIITSTPFNASIRDLHGLLTFLDSDFASKKLFEELIAVPFTAGDIDGIKQAHSVLKRIMWRHRKEHVESELGLPPSTMQTLLLQKTGLEKSLYDREYKTMLESVRNAIGLGRGLSKKQQDQFMSLRKLISHPQLATSLGYGGAGSQRTTFANLFADLIFRNQGELYNAEMEYIVLLLKIAAGERFRKEEEDVGMWKGGALKIRKTALKVKLEKAKEYASQGVARDLVHQKVLANRTGSREEVKVGEGEAKKSSEGTDEKEEEREAEKVQDKVEQRESVVKQDEDQEKEELTATNPSLREAAPVSLRYEEAQYWFANLAVSKTSSIESGVVFDPERLTNLFFERRIQEASKVDLKDSRYHPILLDAGDEEEEGEGSNSPGEAILLKNRFRGNFKRSIKKVWYYHPRRKLQLLCNDIGAVEDKIARLQSEASYLQNRIQEELGEEKARLVMKEGFDALQGGGGGGEREGDQSHCLMCLEQIDIPGILPCLHTACFTCLTDCVNKIGLGGKTPCPMCRHPFERREIIEVLPALHESDHVNEFGVKISGLIDHIRIQLQHDPSSKIVVFSAWSNYLVFLTEALNNLSEPIPSVAFSGKGQSKALQEFQNNDLIRIILVPMKMAEGAAGLTLNNSSLGYLLEPSLDSALEDQALGRLNRIGQKAEKTTYFRVLVENTIGEFSLFGDKNS